MDRETEGKRDREVSMIKQEAPAGKRPGPWELIEMYYFFCWCFFKKSSIDSSKRWLIGFLRSIAKCFSLLISSGLILVVKLSLITSFLVLIHESIGNCINKSKNYFLDIINVLMYS